MIPPSLIPVHFLEADGGSTTKVIACTGIPRPGDLVFPERGSPAVVVQRVAWKAFGGDPPFLVPIVSTREPTGAEKIAAGDFPTDGW